MSTHNSKSILARALAQENIRVEHSPSATTAMFDVANRVLVLPVWKDMTNELHDMFVGHEVGHALFTPYTEADKTAKGPWCAQAEKIGGTLHAGYVQSILNIVEDARIDRKMKERYPGLRRDYAIGYNDLMERDFFGTRNKNIADLSFGDRLNIHFKCGHSMEVPFSDTELALVDAVEKCDSFDDVVKVSQRIFDHLNGQRADAPELFKDPNAGGNQQGNGDPKNGNGNGDARTLTNPNSKGDSQQKSEDQKGEGSGSNSAERKDSETKSEQSSVGTKAGSGMTHSESNDVPLPQITTQSNFDKRAKEFVDGRANQTIYADLAKPDLARIILPWDKTLAELDAYYTKFETLRRDNSTLMDRVRSEYTEFLNSTKPLINTLIKQFEMRKAADVQKRTSVSRTGRIDCDRIFKYRVSDDIFCRFAKVADGKNHGLVMFIDWSSSMSMATHDTIQQVLILTQFCRRMNIPFDVYLFSSNGDVLAKHLGISMEHGYVTNEQLNQWKGKNSIRVNSRRKGDASSHDTATDGFSLIHILSSDMRTRQSADAMRHLFTLGVMISHPKSVFENMSARSSVPDNFNQGNTPLDPTVLCAIEIVRNFQEKHKVQVMNTIFLTDGDSGYSFFSTGWQSDRSFVRCPYTKMEFEANDATPTDTLLRMFKNATGSTTIGFFVCGSSHCRYLDSKLSDEMGSGRRGNRGIRKYLAENGYYDAPQFVHERTYNMKTGAYEHAVSKTRNHGYDRLYVLPANIGVTDELEDLDGLAAGATIRKIQTAFMSSIEKKSNSRLFLNRFADVIADPSLLSR